jgi:hypothetical protein
MRNTVVLEVVGKRLSFWPFQENAGSTAVSLSWWPTALTRKMTRPGIYVVRHVSRKDQGNATAQIRGRSTGDYHPAKWYQDMHCDICGRLLDYWRITVPEYTTRTFHFKVTRL